MILVHSKLIRLAAICSTLLALQPSGMAQTQPDNAPGSNLPEGQGLAANCFADRNIATDRNVIFADDFEDGVPWSRWDDKRDPAGEVLAEDDPALDTGLLGDRCLRVTATLGRNTGGGLTKWFPPAQTVFVRFYVKFDKGCDYIHHFVTLRANRGLTGKDRWSGFGGAGLKPAGDERFSTALEPWGNWGHFNPPGRWNFYSYWHEMKPASDGRYWGNSFAPEHQPDIQRGEWICAEFMLKENTPGQANGEQAFWIDGQLRGHWKQINWRKSAGLRANALTLESYVTDRWTKHPTNIVWFDNLVIARRYIGPSGSLKKAR